jgi:hypothetical protein
MAKAHGKGYCPVTLEVALPRTLTISNRKQLRHMVIKGSGGQRNKLRSCWYMKKTAGKEERSATSNEKPTNRYVMDFEESIPEAEPTSCGVKHMQIDRTQSLC